MYTKAMIAAYRYRMAVAKGDDPVDSLVRAVESVSDSFYEYADIYNLVKTMI